MGRGGGVRPGWHPGGVVVSRGGGGPARPVTWESVRPAPVVLITGTESLLAERAAGRVRDLARQAGADLEVVTVDGSLYESGQLSTWTSPSLFEEPRLVEVVGVEAASDALVTDLLAHLALVGAAAPDELPADLVLVLRHAGGARARKVLDAARAVPGAQVVDCAPVRSPRDVRSFLQGEFTRQGRPVTPAALDQLQAALGADLRELAAAVAQLASDVPAGAGASRRSAVDVADVDRYYGGRAEVTGFAVADAAVAGHREEALRLTRQALEAGVDPIPMIAALAMKLRAMAKVAHASSGPRRRETEVARTTGMAPWQVERARAELRGWDLEGIAAGLLALAEADAAAKGLSRDPVYAIERAVLVVVSSRG